MEEHGLTPDQKAWVYEQLESGISREELAERLRRMADLVALRQEGLITIETLPDGSRAIFNADRSNW
jgi:hypothetical protein